MDFLDCDEVSDDEFKVNAEWSTFFLYFDEKEQFCVDLVNMGRHCVTVFPKGTSRMLVEVFLSGLFIPKSERRIFRTEDV